MSIKIYNNPSSSKCVKTLSILGEKEITPTVINYLETPPSEEELKSIIEKLRIKPIEMIRQKERIFQEKFADRNLTDEECIQAMIEYPILIERPIIINGDIAVIRRPPIKILDVL